MTMPQRQDSDVGAEPVLGPPADVIPFPIHRTRAWHVIASEYMRRPDKGRYGKDEYADKVIRNNAEHMGRLGVAPERIDAQIARLEHLFDRLDCDADEKVRA